MALQPGITSKSNLPNAINGEQFMAEIALDKILGHVSLIAYRNGTFGLAISGVFREQPELVGRIAAAIDQ